VTGARSQDVARLMEGKSLPALRGWTAKSSPRSFGRVMKITEKTSTAGYECRIAHWRAANGGVTMSIQGSVACELAADELDVVSGGLAMHFVALNPQPIPPGRSDFGSFGLSLRIPRTPGCPGPLPLPPNPC
jgi:hypothetical protein